MFALLALFTIVHTLKVILQTSVQKHEKDNMHGIQHEWKK